MSNKPKYLEMTIPVASHSVQWCDRVCCRWGQKKYTHDIEGKLKGGITPLWENPSPLFYKILFYLTLVGSIIFIASFVVIQHYNFNLLNSVPQSTQDSQEMTNQNNNKQCVEKSYSYLKSFFIIIGSAILLVNSIFYLFLACVKYASDQEWSRYLVAHSILWIALIGFLVVHFITIFQNLSFYKNDPLTIFNKTGTESCKNLFTFNMWLNLIVAILVSILAILQVIKIFTIGKKFFITNYVPHSAVCTDDDIVVFYN